MRRLDFESKLGQVAGRESEESSKAHAEGSGQSPTVIIRKQSREQAEQASKKRQDSDLVR
ncbi:MAG: hypothetical protein R6U22_11070 [Desulfohalobiaceae bacterium]